MNARPHSVPLPSPAEAPDLPAARDFAKDLMRAATVLLPQFEAGKPIDAAILRSAMEDAFGTSDSNGAWVWKDAYEAVEIAARGQVECKYVLKDLPALTSVYEGMQQGAVAGRIVLKF